MIANHDTVNPVVFGCGTSSIAQNYYSTTPRPLVAEFTRCTTGFIFNGMKKTTLILSILIFIFFGAGKVFAFDFASSTGLGNTAQNIGYNDAMPADSGTIATTVGYFINIALSLIGLIFMIIAWMGALDILGANGNEELLVKGKARIKNGAIGILIIFAAFIFVNVVLGIAQGGQGREIFKIQ